MANEIGQLPLSDEKQTFPPKKKVLFIISIRKLPIDSHKTECLIL